MNDLLCLVETYFVQRQFKFPNVWQAMAWLNTEVGEVYELLLIRDGGWVRNNPKIKSQWSSDALADELGDILMMVVVVGLVDKVNPVEALIKKMRRKINE